MENEIIEKSCLEENEENLSDEQVNEQEENKEIEKQEQEEKISNEENEIIKYNPEDFNLEYIIKYLMKKEVIVNQIICDKCELEISKKQTENR